MLGLTRAPSPTGFCRPQTISWWAKPTRFFVKYHGTPSRKGALPVQGRWRARGLVPIPRFDLPF